MVLRSVLLLIMLFLVSACSFSSDIPAPPENVAEPAVKVSPLAKFVAEAKPGDEAVLADPEYGQVKASARDYYYAASGKWCRKVVLDSSQLCEIELVFCRDDDGDWKEAPLCWQGCE